MTPERRHGLGCCGNCRSFTGQGTIPEGRYAIEHHISCAKLGLCIDQQPYAGSAYVVGPRDYCPSFKSVAA